MEVTLLYILFILFGFCANFVLITKYGPPAIGRALYKFDMYLTALLSLIAAPGWFILVGIWFIVMLAKFVFKFIAFSDDRLFAAYVKVATKIQNL